MAAPIDDGSSRTAYLTSYQAAQELGCSDRLVRNLTRAGTLPGEQVVEKGRITYRYQVKDVLTVKAQREVQRTAGKLRQARPPRSRQDVSAKLDQILVLLRAGDQLPTHLDETLRMLAASVEQLPTMQSLVRENAMLRADLLRAEQRYLAAEDRANRFEALSRQVRDLLGLANGAAVPSPGSTPPVSIPAREETA